jgi:hypothetical protein
MLTDNTFSFTATIVMGNGGGWVNGPIGSWGWLGGHDAMRARLGI